MSKQIIENQKLRLKVMQTALYILENKATVRDAAKALNIPKSTVHKYMTVDLAQLSPETHKKVQHVLKYHSAVRHLRGGEATKIKYKKKVS